jgi:hypothetical protein
MYYEMEWEFLAISTDGQIDKPHVLKSYKLQHRYFQSNTYMYTADIGHIART